MWRVGERGFKSQGPRPINLDKHDDPLLFEEGSLSGHGWTNCQRNLHQKNVGQRKPASIKFWKLNPESIIKYTTGNNKYTDERKTIDIIFL